MITKPHLARPARVVLVAALAIGATPVLAQVSAEPQTVTPTAPAIAVPDIAPSAAAVEPVVAPPPAPEAVVQDVSEAAETAPPAPVSEPVRTASRREAAPAPSSEPVEQAPVAIVETLPPAPPVIDTVPAPAPAPAPAEDMAPVTDDRNSTALVAIALWTAAILALAIGAFLAFGRRRKPAHRMAVPVIERPSLATAVPPPAADAPARPAPMDPAPTRERAQFVTPPSAAGGLPHAGASVALPRTVPESFEERDALLKRMIEAKPDRANPFAGRRARAKRARLILQALGKDFSDRKPRIDLSQYPNNWPELARDQSVAA